MADRVFVDDAAVVPLVEVQPRLKCYPVVLMRLVQGCGRCCSVVAFEDVSDVAVDLYFWLQALDGEPGCHSD